MSRELYRTAWTGDMSSIIGLLNAIASKLDENNSLLNDLKLFATMIVDNTNCTCEELKKIYEKMGTVPPVQEVPIFLLSESEFNGTILRNGTADITNYYVIYAKSLSGASEVCDFHLENFADSPAWFHDGGSDDVATIISLTSGGSSHDDLAAFNSGWTHKIIIGVSNSPQNFYGHREFTFNFVQDAGLSPELTQELRIYQDYPVPDSYVLTADTALPSPAIVTDRFTAGVAWPYISTKNNQPVSSEIELVSLYSEYADYLTLGTESGNWGGSNERASVEWQMTSNGWVSFVFADNLGFDKYIQFRVRNGTMKFPWFIFKGSRLLIFNNDHDEMSLFNVFISYVTTPGAGFGQIQYSYNYKGPSTRFYDSDFDGRYNGKHLVIGAASGYKITAFFFVKKSNSYYLYNQSVNDSVFVAQDGQLTNFYVPDDDGTLFVILLMERSDGGTYQSGGAGASAYLASKFLFADYDKCPGLPSHFG
jgi:hypothetical protein